MSNNGRITNLFVFCFLLLFIPFTLFVSKVGFAYFEPKESSVTTQVTPTKKVYPLPVQIIIPKITVDLSIEQTEINDGGWEISEHGASHLITSARPGEGKTIIMYGHNTNHRFGPIRWLTKGDHIEIVTADGKSHTYAIMQTMRVKPDRLDIFTQEQGETLILYTCDGYGDSERFVVFAKPLR